MSDLICPKEAYAAQSAEVKPLVIDVRGPKEYAAGHVLGALTLCRINPADSWFSLAARSPLLPDVSGGHQSPSVALTQGEAVSVCPTVQRHRSVPGGGAPVL